MYLTGTWGLSIAGYQHAIRLESQMLHFRRLSLPWGCPKSEEKASFYFVVISTAVPLFFLGSILLPNSRQEDDRVMWQHIQKERMLMQGYNTTPLETGPPQEPRTPGSNKMR